MANLQRQLVSTPDVHRSPLYNAQRTLPVIAQGPILRRARLLARRTNFHSVAFQDLELGEPSDEAQAGSKVDHLRLDRRIKCVTVPREPEHLRLHAVSLEGVVPGAALVRRYASVVTAHEQHRRRSLDAVEVRQRRESVQVGVVGRRERRWGVLERVRKRSFGVGPAPSAPRTRDEIRTSQGCRRRRASRAGRRQDCASPRHRTRRGAAPRDAPR